MIILFILICLCELSTSLVNLQGITSLPCRTRGNSGVRFPCNERLFLSLKASTPMVQVFENIFQDDTLKLVDVRARAGGLGHTVYNRMEPPRTEVEKAIEACLNAVEDKSRYVDYWWRDEWINIDFHRDVDEGLAREKRIIRCPNHAHVLYLQVGHLVQGPTVILMESESEIETMNQAISIQTTSSIKPSPNGTCMTQSDSSKQQTSTSSISSLHPKIVSDMAIVAAKSGRLLRFRGDLAHGVPRPPLAYFDPAEGGSNLEIWSERQRVVPMDSPFRRSVLLFNTFDDPIPLEVSQHPPEGSINSLQHGDKEEEMERNDIIANIENRKELISKQKQEQRLIRVKLNLLGDKVRRGGLETCMDFAIDEEAKEAFLQTDEAIQTPLRDIKLWEKPQH